MMKSFLTSVTLWALAAMLSAVASSSERKPLVSADWVAENAQNPQVRIIEVSVEPGLFEQGHIPGAVNVNWHTELVDNPRRDIVNKENFEKLASRLGITPETTVVLYGDHHNWFAAWGAWIFRYYGHSDVRLLDGGREKWVADKRPLSTMAAVPTPTQYHVSQENKQLRARLADVVAVAEGKSDKALLDIRSPDEFTGRVIAPPGIQELAIRAGHVPGAVNVPWKTAVREDGTFKPVEELRAIYAEKGVDGSRPVIAYCRIGERSAHTWFVLSELLGYEAQQYDGSWTEYGNAVGVPIANPSGTVWTGK